MTRHILISSNPDALARWQEAFPDARIHGSVDEAVYDAHEESIVWLHLPSSAAAAAELVSRAASILGPAKLVGLSDTPSNEQALELMERGALGYCHSHAGPAMLHQVATVVSNQGLWVGPSLLNRLIRAAQEKLPDASDPEEALKDLSPRELEVAGLVSTGATNKEIARELGITERTVKAHLSAVFTKLKVRDRLQLALLMKVRA
jgi:DNA-binding NarL/FixJ family response regulator